MLLVHYTNIVCCWGKEVGAIWSDFPYSLCLLYVLSQSTLLILALVQKVPRLGLPKYIYYKRIF